MVAAMRVRKSPVFFCLGLTGMMSAHVSKNIKSANYHLRNIGKIRKFLNTDTTKSAIVSLVTSRLDYCNGLLCGITDELLCKLQKVQNNAARVVSGSKKYDHITPVLKDLHWLPIRKRIEFKILLLTFKCMQGCAPLYLRELLQYKDSKIKHQELITDTTH